jgi:hypothetical protein
MKVSIEETTLETPKGNITITTIKGGYNLKSTFGTNHKCCGRNMYYSADILRYKLELFYGKRIARKAMDKHFTVNR